jgi:hypothetical protein
MITDLGAYPSLGIGRLLDSHKRDIGMILGESSTRCGSSGWAMSSASWLTRLRISGLSRAQFLQQLDHLRRLLLAQVRQLQDEMLAVLGELILTPLGG